MTTVILIGLYLMGWFAAYMVAFYFGNDREEAVMQAIFWPLILLIMLTLAPVILAFWAGNPILNFIDALLERKG